MKKIYLTILTVLISFSVLFAQEKRESISKQPVKTNVEKVSKTTKDAVTSNSSINTTTAVNVATYDFTVAGAAYVDVSKENPPMIVVNNIAGQDVYAMIAGDANSDGRIKYNGSASDRVDILLEVGFSNPNNIVTAYSANDVNMDGKVKYNGSASDRVDILVSVGFSNPNNIVETHVP
jgi:hypothetical protein